MYFFCNFFDQDWTSTLHVCIYTKTLPEAQRTQGIEAITEIIPTAE